MQAAAKKVPAPKALPSAHELNQLIDQLQREIPSRQNGVAALIEMNIVNLVPKGRYEGYVDDTGLRIERFEVLRVTARTGSVNMQTFFVEAMIDGRLREIDLCDFLSTVHRDGAAVGPRFWPA